MKKLVSVLLLSAIAFTINAQEKDPTLLTIGGKEVKLSEFNAIFNKNKTDKAVTEEAINEYLDLYIKFKLKVREAEALGYDTLPKFINELKGYRKQLAQPYLTDKEVTESLIKEAYERMKQDVRASHILIKVDESAVDTDTIAAYNKIMKIRKRVVGGEDFVKLAKELSEDPSAKKNSGDLGYFTVMQMVYPFESAAYNTKIGEISNPIRTKFGYHIIKVVDKRPARGTIKTAHIMIKTSEGKSKDLTDGTQKQKIDEIYAKLKEGGDFAAIAKQYSDDKGSARKGGELPEFGAGKMVAEFEEAAFALKNDGDFSEPFTTPYGWHIVKRISLKELQSYDDLYKTLKAKVARDSRSNKSKKAFYTKIKTENNFKENIKERNDFYRLITADEYKNGTWDVAKAKKYNKLMFGLYAADGDKVEYTQADFAKFLAKQKVRDPKKEINIKSEINKLYKREVNTAAFEFKNGRLNKTNEEFRLLMNEYRDGILLFDLTDEKVWSKAVKDTVGLEAFYEKNKNNYMWGDRADATVYSCSDAVVAKKVEKILKKKAKKGYTNEQILEMVNTDSQLALKIEEDKFSKGDNDNVDKASWEKGAKSKTTTANNEIVIVVVNDIVKPQPKNLEDIKGLVTSDYQNHLEKEWITELKGKYDVVVNKEVLKLVK